MRLRLLLLTTLILAGCGGLNPRGDNVRIAVGGRAALEYLPVYLASSLGLFHEVGVSVTLQDVASSAKGVQALLGGSSDVVAGGYDAAIEMAVQGQPLLAIATMERWPPLTVVAVQRSGRQVRTVRDLRGTLVGVSSPGSSTHHFLNCVLSKNGMSPSEISTVGVGVNFSMAAAIQRGKVDAAVAGPLGMALLARNPNLIALADCRTAEGAQQALGTSNVPYTALMARPDWVRSNAETTRKVAQATRRALAWIHQHSAEDIRDAMPKQYQGEDPTLYLAAIRHIQPTFSTDGAMPADGPAHVKDYLGVSDQQTPNARINLNSTYTNDFIQLR